MTLFARHETSYKSQKWSSNVWDGDCRDGDQILCNRCPLNYEVREIGRSEILYENAFKPKTVVEIPSSTNTTDIYDI